MSKLWERWIINLSFFLPHDEYAKVILSRRTLLPFFESYTQESQWKIYMWWNKSFWKIFFFQRGQFKFIWCLIYDGMASSPILFMVMCTLDWKFNYKIKS